MIDQIKAKLPFPISPGWIAVALILIIQVVALVYTYGKLTDRVAINTVAIHQIVQSEQRYTVLSSKLSSIAARLKADEYLLHLIAQKLGAE